MILVIINKSFKRQTWGCQEKKLHILINLFIRLFYTMTANVSGKNWVESAKNQSIIKHI